MTELEYIGNYTNYYFTVQRYR